MRARLFLFVLPMILVMQRSLPAAAQPLVVQSQPSSDSADEFASFAAEMEELRQLLHIPGMAAAVVRDEQLVWAQGFGYADVEQQIPATPDTPFHLASVTKPVAATLLMQLVEEGRLALEDPVSQYGVHLQSPDITVRHLLTHTSDGVPGQEHNYDGNRYAQLARVIEGASGSAFGDLLYERIILPLGMKHTAANPAWLADGWRGYVTSLGLGQNFGAVPQVYRELAQPYQFDQDYNNVPGAYPLRFSPAAGLMASVSDLAKFDIALDQERLVSAASKEAMFTPARSNNGQQLIYGLGWYTQRFQDRRLIWHAGGWSPSVSALLLKAPDEKITFIVLANNYNLTRPYPMDSGDVLYSTPALAFYKEFVFSYGGREVPAIDWTGDEKEVAAQLARIDDPQVRDLLEHELWSYRKLFASVGRTEAAERLLELHRSCFSDYRHSRIDGAAVGVNSTVNSPVLPALLPGQVTQVAYILLGWMLSLLIAVMLLFVQLRRGALPLVFGAAWLLATGLFGLIALAGYYLSDGSRGRAAGEPIPRWRRALGPTLYAVTANMAAVVLVLALIQRFFPQVSNGALPVLLGMFLIDWLCFRPLLLVFSRRTTFVSAWRNSFPVALASTILVAGGAVPMLVLLTERVLRDTDAVSPLFLASLLPAALAGAIVVYPFYLWRSGRSSCAWPAIAGARPASPPAQAASTAVSHVPPGE